MATNPFTQVVTWSDITTMNHDKTWNVLRRLDREQLLVLFARALQFVPAQNLAAILADNAHAHEKPRQGRTACGVRTADASGDRGIRGPLGSGRVAARSVEAR